MRPAWRLMLNRCYRTNSQDYPLYGGRGIRVCERWHTFNNFLQDMGERPDDMTLDRIDNDNSYKLSNCRWATPKEQALNRRRTLWVELNGETKSLCQWADELGLKRGTVLQRVYTYKWTAEKALLTPISKGGMI